MVRDLEERYGVSKRRGCRVLLFFRSSHRYEATRDDQAALRMRIRDLAEARVRYGYYRIYILLRRKGWMVNHKRVYRLYQKEGLSLRRKRPRRHASAAQRLERIEAGAANECWSMDFVSDALYDGRRLRAGCGDCCLAMFCGVLTCNGACLLSSRCRRSRCWWCAPSHRGKLWPAFEW